MRNTFAQTFHEEAKKDSKLCLVVADISPAGAMNSFRQEYPDRFINTGVAEQIMIGMVAGMSMRGLRPFAYTIATFSLYRPFEFIRNDLCYQALPVTVVGIGGGLTYSTLGSTHHAQEDISVACSIPNLQVIAPCDPYEVSEVTKWCVSQENGPVYLRLGKAGEPNLSQNIENKFQFGKVRYLRQGEDLCIIGYGPILKYAIEIANQLSKKGINIAVISVHTLKPIDYEGINEALFKFRFIISIEEMVAHGGLGEKLKLIAWETGASCKIYNLNLEDEFLHSYGSHEEILAVHGVSLNKINSIIKKINI